MLELNFALFLLLFPFELVFALGVGIVEAIRGWSRNFSRATTIDAPAKLVWKAVMADDINFGRWRGMRLTRRVIPDVDDGIELVCRVLFSRYRLGLREVERDDGVAVLYEILPAHTSSELRLGDNHFLAYEVTPVGRGCKLRIVNRLVPNNVWCRAWLRLLVRLLLKEYKTFAERAVDKLVR